MSDPKLRSVPDRTDDVISSNERMTLHVSEVKFKMFFAGLIFAILSFIAAHPIQINSDLLKWIEIVALFLLFISGTLLLAQLNNVWVSFKEPEKITCAVTVALIKFINIRCLRGRFGYWVTFLLGMFFIVIDRSAALLA